MCFDDALDGFDAYLKANRGLSANTRRAYRSDVEECLVALRKQGCVDLNEVTIEAPVDGQIVQKSRTQQHGAQNRRRAWILRMGIRP